MKSLHILLILLAFLFSSCNDELDLPNNDKNDFIIAGKSKNNHLITINDSILPRQHQELNLSIDINNNGATDFEFKASHDAYLASSMQLIRCKLEVFNDVEVLVDTNMYSNYVYNKLEITPKILYENDTIKASGIWLANSEFNLCYSLDYLVYNDSGSVIGMERSIFEGRNGLGKSYMGYRYVYENDTIYGWLEFKIEHFKEIFVYQAAHN